MIHVSKSGMNKLSGATIVLLRNTTWKCGRIERLIVGYLRKQQQLCTSSQSNVTDILEHFKPKKIPKYQFFEAIWRLEKRFIIKVV